MSTLTQTKKITLASVKKFIRENEGKIYIKCISDFSGMTDSLEYEKNPSFVLAKKNTFEGFEENSLGIDGAYFVGQSRDYFSEIETEEFKGIHVYNSCGSFDLAIKKN